MIQRRDGPRLLLEATDAIGVGGERLGENLDRHVTTQTRIARAIHLAHAAGTEGSFDHVGPERCTNGEANWQDAQRARGGRLTEKPVRGIVRAQEPLDLRDQFFVPGTLFGEKRVTRVGVALERRVKQFFDRTPVARIHDAVPMSPALIAS